ncbi:SRPBCC family protein [Streptomyces sp. DSM 42041]|uniref:SRPBCC family protein n=1 Tax=Streptomyces hazeniae TaxID=3075538 RepID=A0ABU2NSU5_9ACTN|nr:SRPBCC family protein [Streptomyces sp. DSM 42041]MDT0380053.1 SRPBCC family protein [Streptomyces sp. DSM 42041]
MELRHEFTVPVPADEAWRVLLDIERVAPCMPGATVNSFDGETIDGMVKVKVGPMSVTYRGTAAFRERDEARRRIVLAADGKEARGQGTVRATVTGSLLQEGEGDDAVTTVTVTTDLTVTGRPAQFGRGVMAEVGDRLIGRFADCLAAEVAGTRPSEEETAAHGTTVPAAGEPHPNGGAPAAVAGAPGDEEPLDLLRLAGMPVAKRAAAALAGMAGLAALLSCLRRRRKPHRLARARR